MAALIASIAGGAVVIGACVFIACRGQRAGGKPGHQPGDPDGQAAITATMVPNPVYHTPSELEQGPERGAPRLVYAVATEATGIDGTASVPGSRPGDLLYVGTNAPSKGGPTDAPTDGLANHDAGHGSIPTGRDGGGGAYNPLRTADAPARDPYSCAKHVADDPNGSEYMEARAANVTSANEYMNVPASNEYTSIPAGRDEPPANADGRHIAGGSEYAEVNDEPTYTQFNVPTAASSAYAAFNIGPTYVEPDSEAEANADMYALVPEQQGSKTGTVSSTGSTDPTGSAGRWVLLLNGSTIPTVVAASVADAETTIHPLPRSRPVAAPVVAVAMEESRNSVAKASSAVEDATHPAAVSSATAVMLEEPGQYETVPMSMLAQSDQSTAVHYALLPEQMSSTLPLDVGVTLAPGPPLFVHEVDRTGAEAALVAAAADDPACVRWLVRPKGADAVLSLLVPSKHAFFHEHVIALPDGTFVCNAAPGKPEATLLRLCGKITETLRSSFNAVSAEPVLRGIDRGDAEEVSTA